jgi:putative transposase
MRHTRKGIGGSNPPLSATHPRNWSRRSRVGATHGFRRPCQSIDVSYETVRYWWNRFGPMFAAEVRGKREDHMRAAALKFMKKLMKRHGSAEAITTDGLRSYKAAMKELGNADQREVGAGPTTGRRNPTGRSDDESGRRNRFRRMKTLQKFSAVHASVHNLFNQERHLVSSEQCRERRSAAQAEWRAVTG